MYTQFLRPTKCKNDTCQFRSVYTNIIDIKMETPTNMKLNAYNFF